MYVLKKVFFCLQVTSALVAFRHHLRRASGGDIGGNGVLYNDPFHDAFIRHHVNSLLPMEDEQRTRFHHVLVVFRLCGSVAHVRIQIYSVSRLENHHARLRDSSQRYQHKLESSDYSKKALFARVPPYYLSYQKSSSQSRNLHLTKHQIAQKCFCYVEEFRQNALVI